jgi:hypothetical protein
VTPSQTAQEYLRLSVEDGPPENDSHIPPVAEAIVNRRRHEQACRAATARNASGRRRFVDPTTSEKDYSEGEMEFMKAMELYKQASRRMFPTWSEVLEVLNSLGYQKVEPQGG